MECTNEIISRRMYDEVKGQNALLKETNARLQKAIIELERRNANQFEIIRQLREEKAEFEEKTANQYSVIGHLSKENKQLKEENDLLKYKAVNIQVDVTDEAAMIARLKKERRLAVPDETATVENAKLIELTERKKEAEIYKKLYMQLLRYHIGDCANE